MPSPSRRTRDIAPALAAAFLAGAWTESALVRRGAEALEPRPRWLRRVARETLALYHRPPLDRPRELSDVIAALIGGPTAPGVSRVRRQFVVPTRMAERRRWPVPPFDGVQDLADWLELDVGHLLWLADTRSLERRAPDEKLRNYVTGVLERRAGPPRVIEKPKRGLKTAQRRVLHGILDLIPVHDAAHGFVRGRSARTHAMNHVGREVLLRLDLEDFFASVAAGRIFGIFRSAGYPEPVAHVLTGLTTTVVPLATWSRVPRPTDPRLLDGHHRLGRRLATPHLPQGAPTSPAPANLTAFALDRRLAALAAKHGATYSRYADDLTFSGTHQAIKSLRGTAIRIVRDEGFAPNERKQVHVTQAGRQRVCGIVVNARRNTPRDEHDRLRAVLHNAARNGPASQNRDGHDDFAAHLQGRIVWTTSLNPRRGARLQQRFDAIDWSA